MMSVLFQIDEVLYVKIQNLTGKVKPNPVEVKKLINKLLNDASTNNLGR